MFAYSPSATTSFSRRRRTRSAAKLGKIHLASLALTTAVGLASAPPVAAAESNTAPPLRYDTDRAACGRADSPGHLLLTPRRLTTASLDCETTHEDAAHTRKATCTRAMDASKVSVTYVLDPSSTNTLDISVTVGTAYPFTYIYYRCEGGRAAPLPYTVAPPPDVETDSVQQADDDLITDQADRTHAPPSQYNDARSRLFDEGATPMILASKNEECAATRFCARYPEALRCKKDKPATGYLCTTRWRLMSGETIDYLVESKTNTVRARICRANCAYDAIMADR